VAPLGQAGQHIAPEVVLLQCKGVQGIRTSKTLQQHAVITYRWAKTPAGTQQHHAELQLRQLEIEIQDQALLQQRLSMRT
jgi:hypothetical protein